MIIEKKFNNNVILTKDKQGREVVVMGNGIAFSVRPGDKIDESRIEKVFVIENGNSPDDVVSTLSDMSKIEIDIVDQIIQEATTVLKADFSNYLYLALGDHIHYALQRYDEDLELSNPLLWEIEHIYPEEFKVALQALNTILEFTGKLLKKDEAGYIALHFVNAQQNHLTLDDTKKIPKIIKQIIQIVEYHYAIELNKNSISYQRFLVHLKFFAQQIIQGDNLPITDLSLFDSLKEKWAKAFSCVMKIDAFIQRQYNRKINKDECFYLMVHIQRVTGN